MNPKMSLSLKVAMYRKLCEEQQKTRSNMESVPNNSQGLYIS
jgi:nucleoprotein TPR